jgi:hypothetical protein
MGTYKATSGLVLPITARAFSEGVRGDICPICGGGAQVPITEKRKKMKLNIVIDLETLNEGYFLEELILQEVKNKLTKHVMDKLIVGMCQEEIIKVMEEVIRPRAREIMLNYESTFETLAKQALQKKLDEFVGNPKTREVTL